MVRKCEKPLFVVAWRGVLLFFPNVFDFWFVLVAGLKCFRPSYDLTPRRAVLWLVPLVAVKEFQEYVLHWGKWLDRYRATDVVVGWWHDVSGLF